MSKATERLVAALKATKKMDMSYFTSTVKKHILGGCGSIFPTVKTVEEAEQMLSSAIWEEVELPYAGVPAWATGLLRSTIPGGVSGMVELKNLPDTATLEWKHFKGPENQATLTVSGVARKAEQYCYAILAKEGDAEFLLTFHPGAPVDAGLCMGDAPEGATLTVADAKAAGYTYAEYSE